MSTRPFFAVIFSILVQPQGNLALAQVDVIELTAADIAAGYADGAFTAVELTTAFLERIDLYERNYNAFISFNPDALASAAALDEELRITGSRGPLHGVPVVIKESMDFAGLPSTAGYFGFSSQAGGVDLVPETDATVVSRLENAGAIILGKTNIPAFSANDTRADTSWAGPTFNAYDRAIAPGASSSGTATAVAASFAVLGLAEETAGSIQNPAGAQSLVGIKPTFGLVPTNGVNPLGASTLDVVGPHAKTVYDAAITLDAIAGFAPDEPRTSVAIGNIPNGGYTSRLSTTALEDKRIGLLGSGWKRRITFNADTRSLYNEAASVIAAQGATLLEDPFAGSRFNRLFSGLVFLGFESVVFDFEQYLERLIPGDAVNSIEALKAATGVDLFGPAGPLSWARSFPEALQSLQNPDLPPDLSDFMAIREDALGIFNAVMEAEQLDALVFPQMLTPSPLLVGQQRIQTSTVSEINIMGIPGVIVPGGFHSDGSPFSLIFVGKRFSEAELLGYAYDYEQATNHRVAPILFIPEPNSIVIIVTSILLHGTSRASNNKFSKCG